MKGFGGLDGKNKPIGFITLKKGVYIQRYKGLGEMNPEQLWETTLDPKKRTLLKVQIEDEMLLDETFVKLMGEKVEPRRNYIQSNAKKVFKIAIKFFKKRKTSFPIVIMNIRKTCN